MNKATVKEKAHSVPKATECGLLRQDWTVEKDEVVSDFSIFEVDWNFHVCLNNLKWANEQQINERLKNVKSVGSLGFASAILAAQDNGIFVIPWEATLNELIFPNTVVVDPQGRRYMLQLECSARWWEAEFRVINNDFYPSHTAPILKKE